MIEVVEIPSVATHDLRLRVLRTGTPSTDPVFAGDDDADALHFGARDGDALVGVASLRPEPTPWRAGLSAVQLRGMAVEPSRQGEGIGQRLLDAVIARARAGGFGVLWANARTSALAFYSSAGMTAVGDEFTPAATGLPHRVVVLDLAP
jgi:GNAT superfamily N-acetyltransferase